MKKMEKMEKTRQNKRETFKSYDRLIGSIENQFTWKQFSSKKNEVTIFQSFSDSSSPSFSILLA